MNPEGILGYFCRIIITHSLELKDHFNPGLLGQFKRIFHFGKRSFCTALFCSHHCHISHVLYTLMVGKQIPLCSFYPPSNHFDALMTAYIAIVKAGDGETVHRYHDSSMVNSIAVRYICALEIGLNQFLKMFGTVKKWKQPTESWC